MNATILIFSDFDTFINTLVGLVRNEFSSTPQLQLQRIWIYVIVMYYQYTWTIDAKVILKIFSSSGKIFWFTHLLVCRKNYM